MRARTWIVLLTLALCRAGALPAQDVQVPLDEQGRIEVISADLARRLGMFGEVDALREARLFSLPDGTFLLEITSEPGGRLQRVRRQLSAAEAVELRRDVTSRIANRAPTAALDQSGRMKLVAGSTLLGLGYYGWATAMAVDPDNSQTSVALYMVAAAGSFFIPYVATRNRTVPDAVASMSLWGATRGPLHGLAVAELGDPDQDKTRFAWTVGIGAAEAIAGGLAAHALRMTPGTAELTGVGGDIGLGAGWGAAHLLKLDERSRTVTVTDPFSGTYSFTTNDRTLQSAAVLAGGGLGLIGGYLYGRSDDWTRGDAIILRNVAAMGGLAAVAGADLIEQPQVITETPPMGGPAYTYVDDGFSRTHTAAGLLGTAGGIALGGALVSGRNFSTGQATLLTLSSLAGGLLGAGIAFLATPERPQVYDPSAPYRDPNDHSELYLVLSTVGAGAGFAALYPAMARQAPRGVNLGSSFQLSINPLAVAHLAAGRRGPAMLGSVRYQF